jgi:hypothetical protein
MSKVIHYSTYQNHNRLAQRELQSLAKDIIDYGTIEHITHHSFSTNEYSDDGSMEVFRSGSKCIQVSGVISRYWIHCRGYRVTEIIEEVADPVSEVRDQPGEIPSGRG